MTVETWVSLYELSCLMKYIRQEFVKIENLYEEYFNKVLKKEDGLASIILYRYFSDEKMLEAELKFKSFDYHSIEFTKQNGELSLVEENKGSNQEAFNLLKQGLTEYYDYFIKFNSYLDEKQKVLTSCDSKYLIEWEFERIKLYSKDKKLITTSYNYFGQKIEDDCEILKQVFVKLEYCPKWCQEELIKMKSNDEVVLSLSKKV